MRLFKFLTLLAFICINSVLSFAQVRFQKSYEQTLKEAAARKIPVFISVDYSPVRNAKALISQFSEKEGVAAYYNSSFVNYRVEYNSPEGLMLTEKYGLTRFPVLLFIKPDGSQILRSSQLPNTKDFFLSLGAEALQRFYGNTGLTAYENDDHLDRLLLKDYIRLRVNSGIFENDKLIERYVDLLTAKDLDYEEVLFILKGAPILYEKAYNFAYTNYKIVDSVYTREPLLDMIWMNAHMINNTLIAAISRKDHALYNTLAKFVYNTAAPNYDKVEKQEVLNHMIFYKGINDTTGFLSQCQFYYDRFFMTINPDSIKRAKKNESGQHNSSAPVSIVKQGYLSPGVFHDNNIMSTAFMLNNGAWDFYTYNTRDPALLNKALSWSQRSIEIDPKATHFDTMAHLLYRLGRFDEALMNEEKAIRLARKNRELSKEQINGFMEEAQKMKNRTL